MKTRREKDSISFEVSAEATDLNAALDQAQADLESYFEGETRRTLSQGTVTRDIQRVKHGRFKVTLTVTFSA